MQQLDEIEHIDKLDIFFKKQKLYPTPSSALRNAVIQQLPEKVKSASQRQHPDTIIQSEKSTFPPLLSALINKNCAEEIIEILLEQKASTGLITSNYPFCTGERFTYPMYMCTNPKFVDILIKKGSKTVKNTLHCILTLLHLLKINIKVPDEIFDYWFDKMKSDETIGIQLRQLQQTRQIISVFFSIKMELFHKFFTIINEYHKDFIGVVIHLCISNPKFLLSILKNFKIDDEIIQNPFTISYTSTNKIPFYIMDEVCHLDSHSVRLFDELIEELINLGIKPGPKSIVNLLLNTSQVNVYGLYLLLTNGGKLNSLEPKIVEKFIDYANPDEIEKLPIDWNNLNYFIKLLKNVPVAFIEKIISSGKLDKISFQNLLDQFKLHHLMDTKYIEENLIYLMSNFKLNANSSEILYVCPTKNILLSIIDNKIPLPNDFSSLDTKIIKNIEILQILLTHDISVDDDVYSAKKLIPYPDAMKLLLPKYNFEKLTNSFSREGNLMHYCVCHLEKNSSRHFARYATLKNVEILLDFGWDVNKTCCARKKIKNPLAHAVKRNDSALFNLLIDSNADPTICMDKKMNSLSTDGRVWKIINLLLSQNFDTKSVKSNSIPEIFKYSLSSPRRSILLSVFKRLPEDQIQIQKDGKNFIEFAFLSKIQRGKLDFSDSEICDISEAIKKSGMSMDDIEELIISNPNHALSENLKKCILKLKQDISRTKKSARSVSHSEEDLPDTKKQKLNDDVSHLE